MKKIFTGRSLQFLNNPKAIQAEGRLNLTADDLESEAMQMSNYGGGGGHMSTYVGLNDDFLEFDGKQGSFIDPMNQGKLYTLTITNANTGATRYSLLCPGLIEDAVGLITDGAFNDTTGATGLSASGQPNAIVYFNAFVKYFPSIVAAFKVSTSNINQMEQTITIQKQSPFKLYDSRIIFISAWANEINPQTQLVSVQESFYMDNQTLISYPVLPSTSVSLQLFFGPSLNISHALREKAEKAKANIGRIVASTGAPAISSYRGRRG